MNTFSEASQWIRDYVNEPRHQQHLLSIQFSWHQLCTAMDVVDDVDLALDAYLADIVRPSIQLKLTDVFKEVRDLRSASIGHPTEFERKGKKSVHALSRPTLG
jgi:hypothetical protein